MYLVEYKRGAMSNHFHFVLWPHDDGDLSRWMQWLLTSHVRRYHRHYHGSRHVWQGRFKAFPIEADEHLWTVVRYVERNALRAHMVRRDEDWRWSAKPAFIPAAARKPQRKSRMPPAPAAGRTTPAMTHDSGEWDDQRFA